jgi:hypothetical protein
MASFPTFPWESPIDGGTAVSTARLIRAVAGLLPPEAEAMILLPDVVPPEGNEATWMFGDLRTLLPPLNGLLAYLAGREDPRDEPVRLLHRCVTNLCNAAGAQAAGQAAYHDGDRSDGDNFMMQAGMALASISHWFDALLASSVPHRTCPTCGRTSYNLMDIAEEYCGVCGFADQSKGKS